MDAIAQEIYSELTVHIALIIENPSENPSSDFKNMCLGYFEYVTNNPVKYRFISGSTIDQVGSYQNLTQVVSTAYEMVKNFLIFHIEKGNFRDLDPDKMAIHAISTIHGYCSIVIENKLKLLDNQTLDHVAELDFIIDQLLFILKPIIK